VELGINAGELAEPLPEQPANTPAETAAIAVETRNREIRMRNRSS
jgi:hypothetical protein